MLRSLLGIWRLLLARFVLGFLVGFTLFVFSNDSSEQWHERATLAEIYALQILAMQP